MGINVFPQSSGIEPTKPFSAEYNNGSTAQNTYYTIVDVTAGSGILTRVKMAGVNTAFSNSDFQIQITIDGVAYPLTKPTTSSFSRGIGSDQSGTSNNRSANNLTYLYNLIFKTSLKIEVRHTKAATSDTIQASADYSLI